MMLIYLVNHQMRALDEMISFTNVDVDLYLLSLIRWNANEASKFFYS